MKIKLSEANRVRIVNAIPVSQAKKVLNAIYLRLKLDPAKSTSLLIANIRMRFLVLIANQQGLNLENDREFNICNIILERSTTLN